MMIMLTQYILEELLRHGLVVFVRLLHEYSVEFLENQNWINRLIFWELELLKLIGYDLDLKKIVKEEIVDNKKSYFVLRNNEKKYVPNFIVDKDVEVADFNQIFNGLKLIGEFLDKSILYELKKSFPCMACLT